MGLQLRYGSVTERNLDPSADGQNTAAAIAGLNQFTVDIYSSVIENAADPNLVISPYSLTFALGMVYAGAGGETADEMARVLHNEASAADWHEGLNAYDLSLDARTVGSSTEWTSANKVWTSPGLELLPSYLDILTGVYGSPLAEANFSTNTEEARQGINDWILDNTNQLIPELFAPGSIDPATEMVLVNAVALDAPWEFPFDPDHTTDSEFTLLDGTTVNVPTMHYDEFLPSAHGTDFSAVEIPYGGGALSMVVIVPTDFVQFESDLTADRLEQIVEDLSEGGIHLSLPKWTTRTHLNMNEVLKGLGMQSAFGPSADFSGMLSNGGLWIDIVEHEAFIEVDENGTRAAAASGSSMMASHGPTVEVTRPFIYLIRDRGAGAILFIGRVLDPFQ